MVGDKMTDIENAEKLLSITLIMTVMLGGGIIMFMLVDLWLDGVFSTHIKRRIQKWLEK